MISKSKFYKRTYNANIIYSFTHILLIFFSIFFITFLSSCKYYVDRGEEVKLDNVVPVYLKYENNKYFPIYDIFCQHNIQDWQIKKWINNNFFDPQPNLFKIIKEISSNKFEKGFEWILPKGIKMIGGNVEVTCREVQWSDPSKIYTVKGLWIKPSGKLIVQNNCPNGTYSVYVVLPILSKLCNLTNSTLEGILLGGGRLKKRKPVTQLIMQKEPVKIIRRNHSTEYAIPVTCIFHVKN